MIAAIAVHASNLSWLTGIGEFSLGKSAKHRSIPSEDATYILTMVVLGFNMGEFSLNMKVMFQMNTGVIVCSA